MRNILPVSAPLPPPCDEDTLWQLLSNMRLNYIPLTDVAAFRAMIAPYAFRAKRDRAQARALDRILQSIRAIASPTPTGFLVAARDAGQEPPSPSIRASFLAKGRCIFSARR